MDGNMPMQRIVACCGLICSDCEAYIATQAGDQAALEKVAAKWREEYNAPGLTVDDVPCDGCLVEGRKCSHCAQCDVRACGIERGVANCAHCSEYACDKLQRYFGFAPHMQTVLDEVRAGL
jgi:hypothetical protein